jgi:hypothetical protein
MRLSKAHQCCLESQPRPVRSPAPLSRLQIAMSEDSRGTDFLYLRISRGYRKLLLRYIPESKKISAHGSSFLPLSTPLSSPHLTLFLPRLNESAIATLATAGKGQSLNPGGSSAWEESSRARQSGHGTSGSSAFRDRHNEQHIRQSEDDFSSFLDGIDSLSSAPYVCPQWVVS